MHLQLLPGLLILQAAEVQGNSELYAAYLLQILMHMYLWNEIFCDKCEMYLYVLVLH